MNESNPPTSPQSDIPPAGPAPAPGKRRWPKRLLVIAMVLVVGLVLLVVLLPTLLSTAPARRLVLRQADSWINGKLSINNWRFGWTSGIELDGLSIRDARGAVVLSVDRISTPLTLLAAVRGNYDLGQTVIDHPVVHLVVDQQGRTNLADLLKPSPSSNVSSPSAEGASSGKFPNVRGMLKIQNLSGTISGPGVPEPLSIQNGDLTLDFPSLDGTITQDIRLAVAVGDQSSGELALAGSARLLTDGQFASSQLTAKQTLTLKQVPASALAPFLKMAGVDLAPQGIIDASLDATLAGENDLSAKGNLGVRQFILSGRALQGDTLRSSQLSVPIDVSRTIKDGQPWLNGTVAIRLDQGSVDLEADLPPSSATLAADLITQAIQSAMGKPSSQHVATDARTAGRTVLKVNLDLAALVNQLPHFAHLTEGTQLDAGQLAHRTTIDLAPARASIVSKTTIQNVRGKVDSKIGALAPIELNVSMSANGGAMPSLSDIAVRLNSGFATIDGGGASLGQLNLKGVADLGKAQAEVGQFFDLERPITDLLTSMNGESNNTPANGPTKIAGQLSFTLTGSGEVGQANTPLRVQGSIDTTDISVSSASGALTLPVIALAFDLPLQREGDVSALRGVTVSLKAGPGPGQTLDLSASGDFNLADASVPNFVIQTMRINLAMAQNEFGSLLPALARSGLRLEGGQFVTSASGSWIGRTLTLKQLDIHPVQVHLSRTVDAKRQPLLNRLTAQLKTDGTLDFSNALAIRLNHLELVEDSGALNLKMVGDGPLELTIPTDGPMEMSGAVALSSKLASLQTLVDALVQSPPAMRWTGGAVDARLLVSARGSTTTLNLAQFQGHDLSFQNGSARYVARPINLTAQIQMTDANGKLDGLQIAQLNGDLGLASIKLSEPVMIRGLSTEHPSVNGAVAVNGQIQPVLDLIDALGGKAGGARQSFSGAFSMNQSLSTQDNQLTARGAIQMTNLAVQRDGKVVFEEKSLQISNDLAVDTKAKTSRIGNLGIVSQTSQALNLAVAGSLSDYETQRRFNDVKVVLVYDLLKLFELARPLLSEDLSAQLADAKMWGQYKREFDISGSLPADQPFHQAVRQLNATGGIAIGGFQGMGYSLANLDIPVRLHDGKLTLGGGQSPVPATLNGGKLDLNGAVIDLTDEHVRLTLPPNHALISGVSLNPVLSSSAMGAFNPMFVDPKQAGGFVDVTAVNVTNVPLDGLLVQPGSNSGEAKVSVSVRDLAIENPFTQAAAMFLNRKGGGGAMFRGNINDAKLDIAGGILSQDLTINIGGFDLRFSGKVSLIDHRLMPLNITIPVSELAGIDKNLVKYLPEGITIPITGTTQNFHIAIDKVLPKLISDAATKALLDRSFGGDKNKNQPGKEEKGRPDQQKNNNENPLLDLLNQLSKPDKQGN